MDTPTTPFTVTADGHEALPRSYCRSLAFRRPSRALRIPAALADNTLTRSRAVSLVSREDAVFWGPTAAELLGLPLPRRLEDLAIHVMVPEAAPRPRRAGVVTRQADFVPAETVVVDGLRVTSPARTFMDLAVRMAVPDLVAVGDAAMARYAVSKAELDWVLKRRLRYPGKVRARETIPLLHPGSRSPQESRLRANVPLDGLPEPEVNAVITDDGGGFIACCDLAYREWRLAIEYDGAVHDAADRRRKDATRRTLLREHRWYVVEVVDTDLRYPSRALAKIHAAIRVQRGLLPALM